MAATPADTLVQHIHTAYKGVDLIINSILDSFSVVTFLVVLLLLFLSIYVWYPFMQHALVAASKALMNELPDPPRK